MVTHPVRRGLVSAAVTLAMLAVFLVVPQASRVYASNMIGALRAPGEPAFVAGRPLRLKALLRAPCFGIRRFASTERRCLSAQMRSSARQRLA